MADIQTYLDAIRDSADGESVRDAIIKCMNDINADVAVTLYRATKTKKYTSNGTYTETITAESGKAMSKATFNVEVDIDGGGSGGQEDQIYYDDWVVNNDTANDTYDAEEIFGKDHHFGKVKVEMDVYKPNDVADNIDISLDDLDELQGFSVINYGGGFVATKRVTFLGENIAAGTGGTVGPGGKIYYTANFWEKEVTESGNKIITPGGTVQFASGTVPQFGGAYPTKSGEVFSGWNPPLAVQKRNVDFYPTFSAPTYGGDDIDDTWETIINNHAAPYNYGDTKTLSMSCSIPYPADHAIFPSVRDDNTSYIYNVSLKMMLVAKGENGTSSTWLSKYSHASLVPGHIPNDNSWMDRPATEQSLYSIHDLATTKWLNNTFVNYAIRSVEGGKLFNGIVPVKKYYEDAVGSRSGVRWGNVTSTVFNAYSDKIWLPSIKELLVSDDSFNVTGTEEYKNYTLDKKSINYMSNVLETPNVANRNALFTDSGWIYEEYHQQCRGCMLRNSGYVVNSSSTWNQVFTSLVTSTTNGTHIIGIPDQSNNSFKTDYNRAAGYNTYRGYIIGFCLA